MKPEPRLLWGLPRAAWIAFGLLLLGVLLGALRTLIHPTLERSLYHLAEALILCGLFGPGLLREFGLLRDQDEFQTAVAQRAGWRAFLAGGLALLLMAHFTPWPDSSGLGRELPKLPIHAALLAMLLTYASSYLQDYWGARRGAAALLGTLAVVFALTALLELPSVAGVLLDLRFSAGLLLALLLMRRLPQVAGVLLLVFALLVALNLRSAGDLMRLPLAALLITPPLVTGATLIREGSR